MRATATTGSIGKCLPHRFSWHPSDRSRYIEPLATKTLLRDVIRTSSRVTAVGRAGFDKAKTKGREAAPFEIRYQNGKGPETLRADAVIDASGTWASPNPAGAGGLTAIGEREAAARISYGMPDVLEKERARFAGKTVAVLGGRPLRDRHAGGPDDVGAAGARGNGARRSRRRMITDTSPPTRPARGLPSRRWRRSEARRPEGAAAAPSLRPKEPASKRHAPRSWSGSPASPSDGPA